MKNLLAAAVLLLAAGVTNAQDNALDKYLSDAGTIVIARCLAVGPVNIIGRSDTRVQILYVIKGKETLREISVNSHFAMSRDETYLLTTKGVFTDNDRYFTTDTRDAVIPFYETDRLEEFKKLPPRIQVLRTMNIRADSLESHIRSLQYELDALDTIRRGN